MADSALLAGWLSVEDAAAQLYVSRSTVYHMIDDGRLAAIQHGKRSWITPAALRDYIARLDSAAAKKQTERAKRQRPRARIRPPQANSLAVLLDALDGVALSDGERATLTLLAGLETSIVKNLAAVIARARQTR